MQTVHYIEWLKDIVRENVSLVGGKGANLGEIYKSNPTPNGFVVTTKAYFDFLKENNLSNKINNLVGLIDFKNSESLVKASEQIKKEIIQSRISETLAKKIVSAYRLLGNVLSDPFVAVRSSSNIEDLKNVSFAGQMETFLNVKGDANLILKIKEVWASLFDSKALFYRHENKLDHFRIGSAVVIQKMVNSEMSGVIFTIDPVNRDKTKVIIEAIYGLGELLAKGEVTPDHYEVSKKGNVIVYKKVAEQQIMLKKKGFSNNKIRVSKEKCGKQKITDEQIVKLVALGKKLESHYGYPQDVEWAIEKNKIYILQTRPVTTKDALKGLSLHMQGETLSKEIGSKGYKLLLQGDPASPGIGMGRVNIIENAKEISKVKKGDVLVAQATNPDFVPAMKKAVAIVTEKGGRTSHAAIVSRELGVPAIVGAKNATKILKNGLLVTVNGTSGDVYKGIYGIHSKTINKELEEPIVTATKVYVNLSDPSLADRTALLPADGVGLLRAEFIMAQVGTHPKKMIRNGKSSVFVNMLSDSLEKFCRAFGERPVVYRTSDLKTNEYKNLIGGRAFEPHEENPMLGYRGAFRYINDPEVFNLELEAIKKVRFIRGCRNLWIMIPFVRTVKELIQVKRLISSSGLYRSESFKIWMMVEIPSNVIMLEKFINVGLDGVSIGSNDLTQLILGIDRDNSEIAHEFDEQSEAVLWAFERAIKMCGKYKITSSICGQAASMYPSLLEKLVKWGITSVSVSPDAVLATRKLISEFEKKIVA